MRKFLVVFFIVNLFLSSFFLDVWTTANPGSRAIPLITLFEDGTLQIDKYEQNTIDKSFIKGHFYSDKAPLSTFIVAPFYGFIKLLKIDTLAPDFYPADCAAFTPGHKETMIDSFVFPGFWAYLAGSFICGTLPFALMVLLSFMAIRESSPQISPVLLVLFSYYGSFLFIFSGVYFGHLLAGLFLLISYILLKQKQHYFISGLCLGAAFLTEYPTIIALPIWAVLIFCNEKSWKKTLLFISGVVPWLMLNSLYMFLLSGNPFKMTYSFVSDSQFSQMKTQFGFGLPGLESLWGLTLSPYRGVLFYVPVFIVLCIVLIKHKKFNYARHPINYVASLSVAYFFLISSYYMWEGGWSLGPRHLIPVIVLMLYEGVIILAEYRFSAYLFFIVTFIGITVAWFAKSTVVFLSPGEISNPVLDLLIPEFLAGRYNPNNILTMVLHINPAVSIYIWLILFICSVAGLTVWYNKITGSGRRAYGVVQSED